LERGAHPGNGLTAGGVPGPASLVFQCEYWVLSRYRHWRARAPQPHAPTKRALGDSLRILGGVADKVRHYMLLTLQTNFPRPNTKCSSPSFRPLLVASKGLTSASTLSPRGRRPSWRGWRRGGELLQFTAVSSLGCCSYGDAARRGAHGRD